MPFVTEKIWQCFSTSKDAIIIEKFPKFESLYIDEEAEREIEILMTFVKSVRNLRRELNIGNKKVDIYVEYGNQEAGNVLTTCCEEVKKLAYIENIHVLKPGVSFDCECSVAVNEYAKIYISTENLIDKSQELAKLQKELDVSRAQLDQARARLSNQEFMSKAPQKVIQGAREVKEKLESKIEKLVLSINKLTK